MRIKVVEVEQIVIITKKRGIRMKVIKKVNKVVVAQNKIKIHGFINSTMKIVQNMNALSLLQKLKFLPFHLKKKSLNNLQKNNSKPS